MIFEVLLPIRITPGTNWTTTEKVLAGLFNGIITIVMIVLISFAIHWGWNLI